MSETNLAAALNQINKLQTELIQTEQLVKDALQDYIPENLEPMLATLIGGSIPNLLLEIGDILKTADFQIKNFSEIKDDDQIQIQNKVYPVDIKDEMISDEDDEEGKSFYDFQITPEGYEDFEDESISEDADESSQATDGAYIIEGANYDERSKSVASFIALCLQVVGTRDILGRHKGPDKCYLCPHCPRFNSPKPTRFLRHLIQFHESSPLIPLPFVKKGKKRGSKSLRKNSNQKAAAAITNVSQNEDGQYLLTGENCAEKERRISLFISLCLKSPGASEGLMVHKSPSGTFVCPYCPMSSLTRAWKFMRHLVRSHKDSELIPLPFISFISSEEGGRRQSTNTAADADPLATQATPTPSAETPFVISDTKSLYDFVAACNKYPGVQDHLKATFCGESVPGQPRTYVCPHCDPSKPFVFQKTRDFMRHAVRVHPDSEFIPLPFVRVKAEASPATPRTTPRKRKRGGNAAVASYVKVQYMDEVEEDEEIKVEAEEASQEEETEEVEEVNPEISMSMESETSESEFILGLN